MMCRVKFRVKLGFYLYLDKDVFLQRYCTSELI